MFYAGQADYTGLSVDAVIKSKIVPEDIVDEGLIWDSWGANVLIEPYYEEAFISVLKTFQLMLVLSLCLRLEQVFSK
ncbi:hypothetical protein [Serratia marcescens]|uniref:hypothetical protein n=1 Tax=Serratia marcescens TaxID=615 RepID=UPI00311AA610